MSYEDGPRVRYLDSENEFVVRDDPLREKDASRLLARNEYVLRERAGGG